MAIVSCEDNIFLDSKFILSAVTHRLIIKNFLDEILYEYLIYLMSNRRMWLPNHSSRAHGRSGKNLFMLYI